jgi:hypothetical protein
MRSMIREVPLAGGEQLVASLVDLAGFGHGGGHGRMAAAAPAAGVEPVAAEGTGPAETALRFAVPDGWIPGQAVISRGGIAVRREAAFEVVEEDRRVEVTVTRLPAGGNTLLANVNRWRRQIGLEAWTEEQLADERREIQIDGQGADYVKLQGARESILGVIFVRAGTMWFVKLQGDPGLAERETARFEDFVKSLRGTS